ncbi:cation-transporting P-type ATPase [Asinibacterium sp. OR53]|uniref:cation-translocating P-type ATPase n=1 Tax=Asinibacterium sp. OR53 TaxID=925409 RepID=UPI0006857E48|nr:cation-transporting P-type ATPase [Asinibacterium sp. OR53]
MERYKEHIETLVNKLGGNVQNGLAPDAVERNLQLYGTNKLRTQRSGGIWLTLYRQFTDLLVVIFILAGLLDFYLGQYRDGTVLIAIVVSNALIGFYQELKAENILASLKKLVVEKCKVMRGGGVVEILAEDLVPGDIVKLYEGDGVPADIRLIQTSSFFTNEFTLTGESVPSEKDAAFATEKIIPLTERKNCAFMGTTVARGEATGIAYATGMQTEIGKISATSKRIKTDLTPVQVEAADVARKVMWGTIIIAVPLFATRMVLHDSILVAVVFTIGVAAAMVPEGLPAQISTALALGVRRMAGKNAIVKRIAAVETLGSATVIASDKTGTITRNEMTITGCRFNGSIFSISGLGYAPEGEIMTKDGKILTKSNLGDLKIFFLSGYLSSSGKINPPDRYHAGWYCVGDPTEASFSTLAMKAGYTLEEINEAYPVVQSFAFDSMRKRASVIRRHKGKSISFVKGALEGILSASRKMIVEGQVGELDEKQKEQVFSSAAAYAASSYRIIALAYKDLPDAENYNIEDAETDLTFAGFVTMLDPPHQEVTTAIESVFKAHIKVVMITGDNELTARAIAKSIGLMNEYDQFPQVINSETLQKMDDQQLQEAFNKRAVIFSRVSPDDKYRIVDLLKRKGEIVAVTGDGVNDTLSLKRADIGVAMGLNGSKVAQEAATVILLDDNFSTIAYAVREGRIIFRNIEKTVITNLSSNIAELICVLAGFVGAFIGIATPLLVMQILAMDMLGEMFPLTMLTYDPPEKTIMDDPPRNPEDKILTKKVLKGIIARGTVMGIASYGAFLAEYFHNHHLSNHYEKATTVTYVSILFGQIANLLSRRTAGSVWSRYLFSNPYLWGAIALSLTCMLLIVYVPFLNLYFHTSGLYLVDWLFPIAVFTICLTVYERQKKAKRKFTHDLQTN